MSWGSVALDDEDPVLLVGLRDKSKAKFEPFRVNLDKAVHPALREIAENTLHWLEERDPLPYTPYSAPEEGEYLTLETESLIEAEDAKPAADGAPSKKSELAAIVRMVRHCDELDTIGAGQLLERLGKEFYLQAICPRSEGERIGFVSKSRWYQLIKRSRLPLGRDDKNDRLKRIAFPELVVEDDVHVVIGSEQVAILNRTQFQYMVADTALIQGFVPQYVQRIATAFDGRGVKISGATQAALLSRAMQSKRLAGRLDDFAERIESIDVARIADGGGFASQELEPADFVNEDGELACEPDRVEELLDALEGRFFGDAFSEEKRRADRFRKRR